MSETIRVGISDIQIAESPNKLRTAGLGSCVGIVLFDTTKNIAGMIHAMLPDHTISKAKSLQNPGKFVDTAIPTLLNVLKNYGVHSYSVKAKLAGGAEMFKLTEPSISRIGARNVEAAKRLLSEHCIPLVSEETGGSIGRTIEFDTTTQILHIRTAMADERRI